MKKPKIRNNKEMSNKPAQAENKTPRWIPTPLREIWIIFTSKDEDEIESAAENFQMRIQKTIFLFLTILLLTKGLLELLQTFSFFEQPIALYIKGLAEPLWFYKHGFVSAILQINTLVYVANALALSCGFQLAYMLVTKGPDEAVEPIMLGVASAILLILSDNPASTWGMGKSVSIFLLIISIPILYISSRKMKKDNDDDKKKKDEQLQNRGAR
ncbi:TPA: hypothetical protein ACT2TS_004627 [Citrobacter braakii]